MPLVAILVAQVHATSPTMTLDRVGTPSIASSSPGCNQYGECLVTTASALLNTTHANDVIVIVAQCGFFSECYSNISSIVDSGAHVWTLRVAYTPSYVGLRLRPIWEYYTIAASPMSSDRIEVTWSSSDLVPPSYYWFVAIAISGANVRHPWDPSRQLPVENTGLCATCNPLRVSTVAAQDFVIVTVAINDGDACYDLTDISPFQLLYGSGGGGHGESYYSITNLGSPNSVSFTCGVSAFADVVSILGDALQGPGSQQ